MNGQVLCPFERRGILGPLAVHAPGARVKRVSWTDYVVRIADSGSGICICPGLLARRLMAPLTVTSLVKSCSRYQTLSMIGQWAHIRLHNNFARSLHMSPMSSHAKLGLSLASVLRIVVVGCSSYRLNLDATQESFATWHDSRERRRRIYDDLNAYIRYPPPTYTQISEQSVSPGNSTGVS
jgi:hypothetical protein